MKNIYSSLVALVVFVVIAPLAIADPGTTWDNQIPGPGRFQVLTQFGGAAVLDRETGRVWERSPSTSAATWFGALALCYTLEVPLTPSQMGSRKGWRLPTIEELASLVDTSQPRPTLPAGNPFSNVQSAPFWSATTAASDTSNAWFVNFNFGGVEGGVKSGLNFFWCVRGGQGIDGVQ
jgi:Protein of unknown function (DUF1566)